MAGTITVTGLSAGLPGGEIVSGPVTITGTSLVGELTGSSLAVGDNVFPVPSGAVAVAVFLGEAPAATVRARTNLNASDAGLPISPYAGLGCAVLPLPVGVSSLTLNASATVANAQLFFI